MYVVIVSSLPVGCIDAEIERVFGPFDLAGATECVRLYKGYAEMHPVTRPS